MTSIVSKAETILNRLGSGWFGTKFNDGQLKIVSPVSWDGAIKIWWCGILVYKATYDDICLWYTEINRHHKDWVERLDTVYDKAKSTPTVPDRRFSDLTDQEIKSKRSIIHRLGNKEVNPQ